MCQVKDAPVRDWVGLAVRRARATGAAAVFWLDEARPHDAQLIAKVNETLARLDTEGLGYLDLIAGRGDAVLTGADQGGTRHHLGDRERAA